MHARVFFISILFFVGEVCSADWQSVPGPAGGDILTSLVAFQNTILVGTGWGIFSSTNTGATWEFANAGFDSLYTITALGSTQSSVFAGTASGKLFRSIDAGKSWLQLSLPVLTLGFVSPETYGITSINSVDSELFVVGKGIWCSTDDGNSWIERDSGLPFHEVLAFAALQNIGHPSVFIAGLDHGPNNDGIYYDSGGVFRSYDTGRTWHKIIDTSICNVLFAHGGTLYASFYNEGLCSSTDAGQTWKAGLLGVVYNIAYAFGAIGDTLFCATSSGQLYRSSNNGTVWGLATKDIDKCTPSVFCSTGSLILFGASSRLNLATGNGFDENSPRQKSGVFISTNAGVSWRQTKNDLRCTSIYDWETDGITLYCTMSDGLYSSSDNGAHWNQMFGGLADSALFATQIRYVSHPNGTRDLFADISDAGSTTASVLKRIQWQDSSWVAADSGIPYAASGYVITIAIDSFTNTSTYYPLFVATSNNGIYRSSDDGRHWYQIDTSIHGETLLDFAILPPMSAGEPPILFEATLHGLYYSYNYGQAWFVEYPALPKAVVYSVCMHNRMLYVNCASGAFYSPDGGLSFKKIQTPPGYNIEALRSTGNLLVGLNFQGTYQGAIVSSDNGVSWKNEIPGYSNVDVVSVFLKDSIFFLGTAGIGAWYRPYKELDSTTSSVSSTTIIAVEQLGPIFPSPVNALRDKKIIIALPVALSMNATVHISDPLGRVINVVPQESFQSGIHQVPVDISNFNPGMYFATISDNKKIWCGRFMVLR